eukprot:COSAG06_NODE_8704_length_2092_cov_1.925740_1_plen_35_part_10
MLGCAVLWIILRLWPFAAVAGSIPHVRGHEERIMR